MIRLIVYFAMMAVYLASLYYDLTTIPNFQGGSGIEFGRLVYLTMVNFVSFID